MSQKSYDNSPTLYLIPTPIGNMEDITMRALNTLKLVDVVFFEDTRVTGQLLKYFDISRYKLEKMTGISQSTLYYWSINKTVPTVDSLLTISKCLNCSLDFILGRTNLQ